MISFPRSAGERPLSPLCGAGFSTACWPLGVPQSTLAGTIPRVNRSWLANSGRLALRVLRLGAIVYLVVLLMLLLLENTLLYPAPKYPEGEWDATYLPHEDVHLTSADGTKLHGWLVDQRGGVSAEEVRHA